MRERTERYPAERYEELSQRSTPELIRELFEHGQHLVKEEVRLAKAEVRHEARKAARAGASLGAGGAILYCALFAAAATLVIVFDTFLPLWLSALIVTAALTVTGATVAWVGREKLRELEPERVMESLKEDGRWARDTVQSVRSSRHARA